MHNHLSDKELIQHVLDGTQQAYAALVSRYQSYVFTLVLRQVTNREEAEELAQDVFIKAYRYLADFRGDSKFSTWLYQITYTTCISHHRRKKEKTVAVEEEHIISAAHRAGLHTDTAIEERGVDPETLTRAITKLPESDAHIITLFYQHDQSIGEIATIIGLTASNVKVKLFRARQKLKKLLEEQFIKQTS